MIAMHPNRLRLPSALAALLAIGSAVAEDGPVFSPDLGAANKAVQAYWTPERMRNALPKPMPTVSAAKVGVLAEDVELPLDASPAFAPGWAPGDKSDQPDPQEVIEIEAEAITNESLMRMFDKTTPPFVPPASPVDFNNYAPFNRWSWDGDYKQYPMSTVGKLFFVQNGQNFVCSASVIATSTLATAGHCVHRGSGGSAGWSTNLLFCPSYNTGGVDPARGCWGARSMFTSAQWFNAANSDRDYGCIVTNLTGSVHANRVGNITGWLGRAINFPSKQSTFAWGYPAGAPFTGNRLITAVSTEWYQINMNTSEPQVSKYIGSDMTGGASGGPWWINMANRLPSMEIPNTDGSNLTDPGQGGGVAPLLNGVNSHRRCAAAGCPAGSLFSQEMGSPQFLSTAADLNESEDIFAACFNNGGLQ